MPNPLAGPILAYASRLRFPTLFWMTLSLFLVDLVVPDLVPFADEIILGLATLVVSSWKRRDEPRPPIDVRPG